MPELIYDVKFRLDQSSLKKISVVDPSEISRVQQLEQALEEAQEQLDRLNNKKKQTGKVLGQNNKAFSSTNQLLFSFSDGVQDAAQFSQGLAQGMRAIGNNVGFTAELFANLTTRVSEYNNNLTKAEVAQGKQKTVLGELKNSFFSAGGALIALNAALTIGQFLFNRLEKDTKKSVAAIREFVDEASALRDTGGFDFLGIKKIERQLDLIDEFVEDFGDFEQALEISGKASLKFQGTVLSTGRTISSLTDKQREAKQEFIAANKTVNDLRSRFQGLSDDQLKELVKQFKDLNAQLVLNKTLFEMDELAQFIDAQSTATQEALLLVDAGLKTTDFLQTRKNVLQGLIEVEKRNGLETQESKVRYIELNKQLDAVNGALKEYNSGVEKQAENQRKLAEETRKLARQLDNQQASINALNATITSGDATGTAVALALQHQIAISKLTEAMDAADEKQKSYYEGLINAETDLAELQGTRLLIDTLNSFQPAGLTNQFDQLIDRQGDAITSLATLLEAGFIDEETYASSILKLQNFVNTQEKILVSQTVGAVAKAAGAFGDLFGASKEFRIAMAVADGAAAVVSTLASVPFPANLAAAASIAAQVAQQIKTIKGAKIGGSGDVQEPSASVSAPQRGFFETDYRSFYQDPSIDRFSPARPESMGATIVLQGSLDEEVMAYKVKSGNAKIESGTTYLGD